MDALKGPADLEPTDAPPEARPSGTVVPVRDGREGLEVLLLGRNVRDPGRPARPWVFPGGKVDPVDGPAPDAPAVERARHAAVREAHEEAGLVLAPERLVVISRWITPAVRTKRFDTWFFAAAVPAGARVRVDGGEIAEHRWVRPGEALDAHEAGELVLAPPTFVTVTWLAAHREATAALAALGAARCLEFRPRIHSVGEGAACILYPGDAGYEDGRLEHDGPVHRLWAEGRRYRYERSGV